jgi:hypothetical protein
VFIRQGEESKPAARFTKFTKAAALRRSHKHAECVVIILEWCRSPKFNCRVPSNVLRPRDSLALFLRRSQCQIAGNWVNWAPRAFALWKPPHPQRAAASSLRLSYRGKIAAGTVFSCSGKECRFPILISRSARCVLNFQVVSWRGFFLPWSLFDMQKQCDANYLLASSS